MNLLDTASLVVTPNGYKASKLYSIIPSDGTGDMTFTRTGDTATRVNSSGLIETVLANKPRLDYLGGGCPKLLLEPQRTNLNINSADFSTYTLVGLTVGTNVINSPDGTQNADSFIEDTSSDHAAVKFNVATLTASAYTFSVFLKKGNRDWVRVALYDSISSTRNVFFNLNTGVIGTIASGVTASIVNYQNGWYRCIITSTMNATTGGFGIWSATSNNNFGYAGTNGLISTYAYGAQFELGAYSTSYIPTTTASVTRNADFCSNTSATALIGQTEGTIYAEINYDNISSESIIVLGTLANGMYIIRSTAGVITYNINLSSVSQASISKNGNNFGTQKLAASYKNNVVNFFINGTQVGSTDTSATIPATSIIRFNEDASTGNNLKLKAFALWKTALQNSELATLTSL